MLDAKYACSPPYFCINDDGAEFEEVLTCDGAPKCVICENSVIFQLHMTCNKILNRKKKLTSTVRIRTAIEPMLSKKCFKIITITIALASVHRVIAKREIITDLTNLEGENVSQSTLINKNFTACAIQF